MKEEFEIVANNLSPLYELFNGKVSSEVTDVAVFPFTSVTWRGWEKLKVVFPEAISTPSIE
ncbi:hypothetical protein N8Z95_01335, partial [bacterium]|nr:hypothetical protein [bacterium]